MSWTNAASAIFDALPALDRSGSLGPRAAEAAFWGGPAALDELLGAYTKQATELEESNRARDVARMAAGSQDIKNRIDLLKAIYGDIPLDWAKLANQQEVARIKGENDFLRNYFGIQSKEKIADKQAQSNILGHQISAQGAEKAARIRAEGDIFKGREPSTDDVMMRTNEIIQQAKAQGRQLPADPLEIRKQAKADLMRANTENRANLRANPPTPQGVQQQVKGARGSTDPNDPLLNDYEGLISLMSGLPLQGGSQSAPVPFGGRKAAKEEAASERFPVPSAAELYQQMAEARANRPPDIDMSGFKPPTQGNQSEDILSGPGSVYRGANPMARFVSPETKALYEYMERGNKPNPFTVQSGDSTKGTNIDEVSPETLTKLPPHLLNQALPAEESGLGLNMPVRGRQPQDPLWLAAFKNLLLLGHGTEVAPPGGEPMPTPGTPKETPQFTEEAIRNPTLGENRQLHKAVLQMFGPMSPLSYSMGTGMLPLDVMQKLYYGDYYTDPKASPILDALPFIAAGIGAGPQLSRGLSSLSARFKPPNAMERYFGAMLKNPPVPKTVPKLPVETTPKPTGGAAYERYYDAWTQKPNPINTYYDEMMAAKPGGAPPSYAPVTEKPGGGQSYGNFWDQWTQKPTPGPGALEGPSWADSVLGQSTPATVSKGGKQSAWVLKELMNLRNNPRAISSLEDIWPIYKQLLNARAGTY